MKRITGLTLGLAIVALGIISSCSKEKQIERHLFSSGGKWKNTEYDVRSYSNDSLIESIHLTDAGSFEFDKDGTFVWTHVENGQEYSERSGTWSNTTDELTLLVGETGSNKFKILEESKKSIKLELTDIDGTYKNSYTLTLEKDK